jgi:hypothetical protein
MAGLLFRSQRYTKFFIPPNVLQEIISKKKADPLRISPCSGKNKK